LWSFGDGTTAQGSIVAHAYAFAGTYSVTLTVSGPGGQSTETTQAVISSPQLAPVARAGGPYTGTVGSSLPLNGSASSGSITTYLWSFGDGTTAQGSIVAHAYAFAGTYSVTLTVSGPGGQSTETTQAVISSPQPALVASVSLPKSVYTVGEAITITITLNRAAYVYLCEVTADNRVVLLFPSLYDPGSALTAGARIVPAGAYTLRVSEPSGAESLRLYAAVGPILGFPTSFGLGFPVLSTNPTAFHNTVLGTMQATFAASDRATSSVSLTVQSAPPTTGTLRVLSSPTGATVRLDGTAIGTTNLDRPNVSPGLHTVEISRAGYQTETRQATVVAGSTVTVQVTLTALPANQSPVAVFTYAPPSPTAGTTVQFDASASSDPDGTIISYAWSFGDSGTAVGAVVSHVYVATGSYTVQLTVTDNGGKATQVARTVTVALSDDVGWVSPVSFEDPANAWKTETNAYDNNLNTYSWCDITEGQWSSYLFFTLPGTGVLSNRVRLMVFDSSPNTSHFFTWSVEAEVDGVWVSVYSAKPTTESQWFEVAFTQGMLTRLRLRAQNWTGGMWRLYLLEVDAHDSTVSP
jgi:PKD repeat protein